MAILGVVSSAAHNVGVAHVACKYSMSSSTFMRETAPLQAFSIGIVAPLLDRMLTGIWLWDYSRGNSIATFTSCTQLVLLSCVLAAVVNLSLVSCIKAFTATGSQVLGHVKTCTVLVLGWAGQAHVKAAPAIGMHRQYIGGAMAVVGLIGYSLQTIGEGTCAPV